ncbi:MAG: hypothetical protein LRY66_02865 [Saccharospirillaceae bacterium]|nr:hypothetical protein [Saccharospirillaceae bacterium]MCD8530305.1 hypothetical protein [Saccharospirillaceae bacterium]
MNKHIKNLNQAKAAIQKADDQLRELKQKANSAAAELQELENKAETTEQDYQDALKRLALNELTSEQADHIEQERDQAAAELQKRRPRLQATIKAGEPLSAGTVIDEILTAEMAARGAVSEYWKERRPEIESEAREALKIIKLWSELTMVSIEAELRRTELPELPMPLNAARIKSSVLGSVDRQRITNGR